MSSLEEFESALRDVVSTKRVSLSKMNKLNEVAKKCFENDVQMVSMLYRTHKALQPQFKVPSLYAFDALAREARSHALKHGATGDAKSGNSATFLLKLEAVLEGLFLDMCCGVPEGKEKSKKILDIWTKSTTFPPAVLTRLGNVLKGDDAPAVPAPVSNAVMEPVMGSAPLQAAPGLLANAETQADPASQAASVQATLLALLTQASNAQMPVDGPQTLVNNGAPVQQLPRLDTNQLKLFQQLTQTVNSEVTSPPIQTPLPPPPAPATSSSEIVAGPSNPPAHWNNSRGAQDKPWDAGRNYQTPLPGEENDYHGYRGRFRGGYRSRGRGRFGDRDREGYRDRFYDNARGHGVAHGGRRSRSRSPPRSRYGGGAGRRDAQPYSPPHRPSVVADQPDVDTESSSSRPGVDEFGREIRPSSDDDGSETPDDLKQGSAPPQPQPPPAASASSPPTSSPALEEGSSSGEHKSSTTTASQIASATGGSDVLPQDSGDLGLESFDYSTFDPTSPASWEALGRAWAATNGRQPSQEELMMFVMEVTVGMASQANPNGPGPAMQGNHQRTGPRWTGEPRGGPLRGGRGRGGFGARGAGRGGFAYGHLGEDGQARWDYGGGDAYANTTDAIVLGEHTDAQNSTGWGQGAAHEQVQAGLGGEEGDEQTENQGAVGGRMQKMGDGWVFARSDGSS